jgi:hypothetical protein
MQPWEGDFIKEEYLQWVKNLNREVDSGIILHGYLCCFSMHEIIDSVMFSTLRSMWCTRVFYFSVVSFCMSLVSGAVVYADAKVDGFFREDMVTRGMFEGHRHIEEIQPDHSRKETFFISREERRRHPERAVSNSIEPVPTSLRFRRYPLLSYPFLPGAWIPGVHYSPRRLREHRMNSYQIPSQQPPGAATAPPQAGPAPITPVILEPGDSFDVTDKYEYELEAFGEEPEL